MAQEKSPSQKIDFHLSQFGKYRKENPKKSIWHARKALSLAEKHNQKKARGKALGQIGNYFRDQSMSDSADVYYTKALKQFDELKDKTNYAVILMHASTLAQNNGEHIKSFELLMTADSLFRIEKEPKRRIETNVALATLLIAQKEYKKALLYLKRAEELLEEGDLKKKAIIYNNMVGCYSLLKDYKNSYNYANKTIALKKELNDPQGVFDAYNNLAALIFAEKGATPEVMDLLTKASEGYQSIDDRRGLIRSYNSLGAIYRDKKEYPLAKRYLLMVEQLCKEIDDHQLILGNKRELHKLFSETKDWERAYTYYTEFKAMEDSINSLEKVKIIQDLQIQYDTKEFQRESELAKVNEQLSEEKALKSRNTSILILAIGLFTILTLSFVYLQYRQRKKKEMLQLKLDATEKQLASEKQRRLSELKALQSQMNPHFIFNSLNSLQDLILQNDQYNSVKYLGKFSELMRKVLEQSKHEFISVAKEIEMIELYAKLEKLRFGDELTFEVHNEIDSEDSEELMIPSMFIQPYIENAFKHGLAHSETNKTLSISFSLENNLVLCSIEDNGIGRERAHEINLRRSKDRLNFSTEANSQRVDLLNQQEKNNIRLEVIDKKLDGIAQGTIVNIYFDTSRNEEV